MGGVFDLGFIPEGSEPVCPDCGGSSFEETDARLVAGNPGLWEVRLRCRRCGAGAVCTELTEMVDMGTGQPSEITFVSSDGMFAVLGTREEEVMPGGDSPGDLATMQIYDGSEGVWVPAVLESDGEVRFRFGPWDEEEYEVPEDIRAYCTETLKAAVKQASRSRKLRKKWGRGRH